ncbi:MAG: hypothetical protein HKO81_08395 [Flavobacteriaceae bacterium]|nr:hypothetical protein [Flavobacteriaceae bacterium]
MHLLKQIFDFYINASIHVALAVCALSYITLEQLNIFYDENLLFFIFFASITGYNFVKYFGLARFHHRSLANWLRIIQLFSLICFGFMIFFLLQLERNTLIIVAILALITLFYATPFLPKNLFMDNKYDLRSVSGLKVYVIALVWALATVLLPVLNSEHLFNFDVTLLIVQRYLYVIVLILPFDIHDLHYDSLKLATIPQRIGIRNTKIFGFTLLLAFLLLEFFKDDLDEKQLFTTAIITVVTGIFIGFSNKDNGRYYSAFLVEGLPVFWLILLLVFNQFFF